MVNVKTYQGHPFITHDGKDENGVRAEVRVLTGFGHVAEIDESKESAINVKFKVDNNPHGASGWIPKDNVLVDLVRKAHDTNEPIHFRIETRRRPKIDRTTPMAELTPKNDMSAARNNTVKSLAALKWDDDENWTKSPLAVTALSEDPPATGNGIIPAVEGETPPTKQYSSNKYAFRERGPAYTYNDNGELNVGSYAAITPLNILSFVLEQDRKNELGLDSSQQAKVAKVLFHAINDVQKVLYDGELDEVLLGTSSHMNARNIVFEVVRSFFPINDDVIADKESLLNWEKDIVEKSSKLWAWSLGLLKPVLKG